MYYEDVETFLQIYNSGGISQAAARMYLAQSTVSQRLRRLETERNSQLFIRRAGVRKISLTPQGKAFLPLAQKLAEAWENAAHGADDAPLIHLAIGSITSVYDTMLFRLLLPLLQTDPRIQITTVVRSSSALCEMVESGELDYAFVGYGIHSSFTRCIPVYREGYYLVVSPGLLLTDEPVDVRELTRHRELFYPWGIEFRRWHQHMIPKQHRPYMDCDTLSVYEQMAAQTEFWSVCPASAVYHLEEKQIPFDRLELQEPPEARTVFSVQRQPIEESTDKSRLFKASLTAFCDNLPEGMEKIGSDG